MLFYKRRIKCFTIPENPSSLTPILSNNLLGKDFNTISEIINTGSGGIRMKIVYLDKFLANALLGLCVETKEGYMIAGVLLRFNTEDKLISKIPYWGTLDHPERPTYTAFFENIRLGDDREIILGAVKLFNMINNHETSN